MTNFAKAAKEIFEILLSYNYEVKLYDEDGMDTAEPEEARRFVAPKHNLMVAISDNDDNSNVRLFYGKSTHASDVEGLIQALRTGATKYALTFGASQSEKEITPKDLSNLASISERKQVKMTDSLTEGMYGTTRSSYLRMENARMIVRHSRRIDDSQIGARGRCVEQIFIENASGERLLFPSTQIAPARAMTQHVNQGGNFADEVGSQIMRMTNDYANLGQAAVYVNANAASLQEGAMQVREACRAKMRECRKTFERLSKPSSYVKEAAKMMEAANMLAECGEEEIDETRISEVKQLLNNADLPRSVYECCCRAMDKMKEEKPMTEDGVQRPPSKPIKPTIGVLGRRVDLQAWEDLKAGKIDLKSGNDAQLVDRVPIPKEVKGPLANLLWQLSNLLPRVKDETLGNLLHAVFDDLATASETGNIPTRSSPDEWTGKSGGPAAKDWEKDLRVMKAIASKAVKSAHMEPALAENFRPVNEYIAWLDQFNPDHLLSERFGGLGAMDPYSTINGRDMGDVFDGAIDDAIEAFDPQEFIDSPEMTDIISGRDPKDPEENSLTKDEVLDGLAAYLQHYIETYSGDFDTGFEGDLSSVSEELFDRAAEALQAEGFVIENAHNDESLSEFRDNDAETELTLSDLLMPKPDMGNSLKKQVSKTVVKNPDTKKDQMPGSEYIDRLQSIAWTTVGPNGQAY